MTRITGEATEREKLIQKALGELSGRMLQPMRVHRQMTKLTTAAILLALCACEPSSGLTVSHARCVEGDEVVFDGEATRVEVNDHRTAIRKPDGSWVAFTGRAIECDLTLDGPE